MIELVRDAGVLALLPFADAARVGWELFAGDLAAVSAYVEEQNRVQEAIGDEDSPRSRARPRRVPRREAEVTRLDEATTRDAVARGDGPWVAMLNWSMRCSTTAWPATTRHSPPRSWPPRTRPTCTCRAGRSANWSRRRRAAAGRGGQRRARQARRDGARLRHRLGPRRGGTRSRARSGPRGRGRALPAGDRAPPRTRFRTELAPLSCSTASGYAGRGGASMRARSSARPTTSSRRSEWQRSPSGPAPSWRRPARRCASGASRAREDLTAQERQVAELARDGLTNPEIGARLFLSRRTIQYHLGKVFGKLGIRSRNELARALARYGSETAQT